jgi:hypothetical protein
VMEVLPESDWAYLADRSGHVAEEWLCFFIETKHSGQTHLEDAAWEYQGKLKEEQREAYGTISLPTYRTPTGALKADSSGPLSGVLTVRIDNSQMNGKMWQCTACNTMSARNKSRSKSRGKDKGSNKDRTRMKNAFEAAA